jgi:hypothetical protein
MKKTIIAIVSVLVIIIIIYFISKGPSKSVLTSENSGVSTETSSANSTTSPATSTQPAIQTNGSVTVIGKSVAGRDINAYHYGTGSTELLFVGGIHGGYEWNTTLVAYELIDYLAKNQSIIPANVRVTIIPVLNPDGLNKVVGTTTGNFTEADVSTNNTTVVSGRYNGDNVDLNRNFDCDWQATGKWQSVTVSGGSAAFSEPESQAIKSYIETNKPIGVVVWYSAAGGVYASNCHNGVSTETKAMTQAYSIASGYTAHNSFDDYATTGDMTNWLAKNNIPAISVLLTNHADIEWTKNLAGIKALFTYFTK